MLNSTHLIWQVAERESLLEEWIPYAEQLIQKWSTSPVFEFSSQEEVQIALLLLADNLLPPFAQRKLALNTLDAIGEAYEKKYTLHYLKIQPPEAGRHKDTRTLWVITSAVHAALKKGLSRSEAYEQVCKQHKKSFDTVRRIYERNEKRKVSLKKRLTRPAGTIKK